MSVSFGADNPTPQNLTPTSFQVAIGPQLTSTVNVTVTRVNGQSDTATYTFAARRVFVTSAATAGNFGGIAGGDVLCATRASQLGLTGTFLAWLGDATTSPALRFLTDGAAYERLDGTRIADDWADLTDGTLDAPIATGNVWTGVNSNGTASGVHCSNWTSSSGAVDGTRGVASQTDSQWTQVAPPAACSFAMALYCFEQP